MRFSLILILISALFTGCNLPKGLHDEETDYSPMAAPNFKAINTWIIGTRCVECHGAEDPKGKISLSSYEKMFNKNIFPPVIVPGKPEQSSLYESVVTGRMPKGKKALKKKEIQAIYDWIKNGAKKDDVEQPEPQPNPEPGEPGEPDSQDRTEPGQSAEPGEPGNNEPGTN